MQHVFTLRKIFLIFGFALVVSGCDMNKDQLPKMDVFVPQSFRDKYIRRVVTYLEMSSAMLS